MMRIMKLLMKINQIHKIVIKKIIVMINIHKKVKMQKNMINSKWIIMTKNFQINKKINKNRLMRNTTKMINTKIIFLQKKNYKTNLMIIIMNNDLFLY